MPYTKIWCSLSLLIGAIIAVLALARGAWQLWLLLAVFTVWGLWLALTVLLPYAAARRRQREAYRQAEQSQPTAGGTSAESGVGQLLLRHVNYRISAYLKSVYPVARWEWREQQPERLILEGGTGRIRIFGVPDFNFADVQLDTQANLQCSLVKIVPLAQADSAGGESGQLPPNQQPVDPRIWYEVQGRKVLEGEGYAAEVKEDTVAVTW